MGAQVDGQVLAIDRVAAAEREAALDDVLQLADVARPVVARELRQRGRREGLRRDVERLAVAAHVLGGEQRDVVAALAQRRQHDRDDVHPVVEIGAESTLAHLRSEVAVRGGDQAHVDFHRPRRPERHDLALLHRAQELDLQGTRDVGDLVEKEGTAVGGVEDAVIVGNRAGEGAAAMAEELAVEQRLGDGAAVDRHERLLGARAAGVDRPRDELLPGAALAGDEDGAGVGGDGVDRPIELEHGRAAADDVAESLRARDLDAQPRVLALEIADAQHVFDRHQELVGIAGLDEIVVRAELHRLHRGLGAPVAGEHDRRWRDQPPLTAARGVRLQAAQQLHAVHHRHVEIGDDDLESRRGELVERLLSVAGDRDRVAAPGEDLGEGARHVRLVLDEQDARSVACHPAAASAVSWPVGSSMVNVVPTFGVLATRISPR